MSQELPEPWLVLVDVGARGGVHGRWRRLENLQVIGFEPDPQECRRLNRRFGPRQRFLPLALADRPGPRRLYLTANPACASFYPPNFALVERLEDPGAFRLEGEATVSCETLDRLVERGEVPAPHFLKIDAQGASLAILQGAGRTLEQGILGVEVEAEFNPLYQDEPLFDQVDLLLRRAGFVLFDMQLGRRRREGYLHLATPGQVIWTHAVYLRDLCREPAAGIDPDRGRRAVLLARTLGFHDYAAELLDHLKGPCLPPRECRAAAATLKPAPTPAPSPPPSSPERRLLAGIYHSLGAYLLERSPRLAQGLLRLLGRGEKGGKAPD